jgi:hypothetical protein
VLRGRFSRPRHAGACVRVGRENSVGQEPGKISVVSAGHGSLFTCYPTRGPQVPESATGG